MNKHFLHAFIFLFLLFLNTATHAVEIDLSKGPAGFNGTGVSVSFQNTSGTYNHALIVPIQGAFWQRVHFSFKGEAEGPNPKFILKARMGNSLPYKIGVTYVKNGQATTLLQDSKNVDADMHDIEHIFDVPDLTEASQIKVYFQQQKLGAEGQFKFENIILSLSNVADQDPDLLEAIRLSNISAAAERRAQKIKAKRDQEEADRQIALDLEAEGNPELAAILVESRRLDAEHKVRLAREEAINREALVYFADEQARRAEEEEMALALRMSLEDHREREAAAHRAQEDAERLVREAAAREEEARLERERLARAAEVRQEEARLERERLALEEAARLERERLAREEENDRLQAIQEAAARQAAVLAAEERRARAEAERLQVEAARVEAARLEQEQREREALQAEQARLAEEEAHRAREAAAREAIEQAQRAEAERLQGIAREQAAQSNENHLRNAIFAQRARAHVLDASVLGEYEGVFDDDDAASQVISHSDVEIAGQRAVIDTSDGKTIGFDATVDLDIIRVLEGSYQNKHFVYKHDGLVKGNKASYALKGGYVDILTPVNDANVEAIRQRVELGFVHIIQILPNKEEGVVTDPKMIQVSGERVKGVQKNAMYTLRYFVQVADQKAFVKYVDEKGQEHLLLTTVNPLKIPYYFSFEPHLQAHYLEVRIKGLEVTILGQKFATRDIVIKDRKNLSGQTVSQCVDFEATKAAKEARLRIEANKKISAANAASSPNRVNEMLAASQKDDSDDDSGWSDNE